MLWQHTWISKSLSQQCLHPVPRGLKTGGWKCARHRGSCAAFDCQASHCTLTCQDISPRCGKIEQCFSGLPLACEWKELVLCSPSICFRPVKPSWRQDRRIIKVVWSGKGRTPSNCLRDCTSRDRCHITSRKDSKPLALVCVVMPGMFCQDTPFIYFAAWTNCQECRGILWYSRHVHEDFRLLCPFSIRTKIKQLTRLREKVLPLFACTSQRFWCGALKKCRIRLVNFHSPVQRSKRRELVENSKLNQIV